MFKILFFAATVVIATSGHAVDQEVTRAIVRLDGDGITGAITFTKQDDGNVRVTGTVNGLPPGLYGFHVHQTGDVTKGCGSTGGHFNPNGNDHPPQR